MKLSRVLFLFIIVLIVPTILPAQVGFTLGNDYGIGVVGQVGTYGIKFEAGAGVTPIFFYAQVIGGSDITELWFPFCAGAKINFALTDEKDPNRLALKLGVNYNQILGVGFGGGADYTIAVKPSIILSGGIQIYPDAKQGCIDKLNEDRSSYNKITDLTVSLVELHPYVSISILFD
jgi:hypothetical protein